MELLHLKIFKDIACEKNFVKVAKLNFLTQPSISTHLKRLEEELGVKLFERVPRKVTLTKEGAVLLPHAEEILHKYESLKERAARIQDVPQGNLRVATVYSVGIYELTTFLKKFIRTYPEINIHLQYRRSDIIYDLILKEKIDVGIVAYPEPGAKIKVTPFGTDHLVLIAPPDHPLAKRRHIRLRQIQGQAFIAFEPGIPTREAIDQALDRLGIKVQIRMTNENIDTLKRAVEVGLGISIVPSKTIREEVEKGTLKSIELKGGKLDRPLGILALKERMQDISVQLFIQILTNRNDYLAVAHKM